MYKIEAYQSKPYGCGNWKILNKTLSAERLKRFHIPSDYKQINIWDINNMKYLIHCGNAQEAKKVIENIIVESWEE